MAKRWGHTYTRSVTRPLADESDPRDFLRLLWRRKWILIPCLVLIPLAAYFATSRMQKQYQASAVIQLQDVGTDQGAAGVGNLTSTPADQQTNDRVAALIGTSGVADTASQILHEPKGSLRGAASAGADQDTGFITIVATGNTGARAAQVANAFAAAVKSTRAQQGRASVNRAIASAQTQLQQAPKSDVTRRQALTQQIQQLQAVLGAQSQNAQVIQAATAPTVPSSPHPRRNAILALLIAIFLGAGLVSLADRMDRRLREPDELEALAGAPLLIALPATAFSDDEADPGVPLAFQMLRDSLTYFNVDQRLDSLVVVSSLKGEGKTTVVANLASSYARSDKRIIALCCDLRNPQLGRRMGVDTTVGLSTLLRDGGNVDDFLQAVEPFGEKLRVLPGGPVPPNPSELLGSERMAAVLEALKNRCDLVIIDTAPLLLVSDAFALLPRVSGTVGVTRLDTTPRQAVRRMAEVTATAGGHLLGMVATGLRPTIARHGSGYGYGYGYGYGETPAAEHVTQAAGVTNGHAPESQAPNGSARAITKVFRSR
jgi:capsular exopolysaccharide synthesis family protein